MSGDKKSTALAVAITTCRPPGARGRPCANHGGRGARSDIPYGGVSLFCLTELHNSFISLVILATTKPQRYQHFPNYSHILQAHKHKIPHMKIQNTPFGSTSTAKGKVFFYYSQKGGFHPGGGTILAMPYFSAMGRISLM